MLHGFCHLASLVRILGDKIIANYQANIMSRVYSIQCIQHIPASIEEVWKFFSDPSNLKKITPEKLDFVVISKEQEKMYAGQIIEYTIRPLFRIPVYWMTEIMHVKEQQYFIDEQRYGPYSFWHHQHFFEEVEDGVVMKDLVHYKIPFWFIGDIANTLFVRKQLKTIFSFRFAIIANLFGNIKKSEPHIVMS